MTSTRQEAGYRPLRESAAPAILADEHALLLGQVRARAGDALATIVGDRPPARELRALVGYVRAELLSHAADEERLLFPGHDTASMTRLARDHARLRAIIEVLESAAAGERPISGEQLATAIQDFLCQLERHLGAEEALLARDGEQRNVAATTELGGQPHGWYALTEGPVIDLESLPAGLAVDAAVHRLQRLRDGERVELESRSDPDPVWRRLRELGHHGFGFVYLEEGPSRWRVQVSRRATA